MIEKQKTKHIYF